MSTNNKPNENMTKTEDLSVQQKLSYSDTERKKDKDRPPSKIVIRRLPPSLTPEDFLEQVSPLPDYDFFYFVRAEISLGPNAFTRAYINFLNAEDVFIFRDKFDGYVFLDTRGGEYPAVVEFSPFLKVPKKKVRKVDSKCGMLEQDGDYKKFVEQLANPPEVLPVSLDAIVEEVEAKELRLAKMGSVKMSTPLLDYLKRRKEEKRMNMAKLRDERRRGGRDRDRDQDLHKDNRGYDRDRRRSGKDDIDRRDRERDRLKERDRRKDRGKERSREKEKERRRDRERGGRGGGGSRLREKQEEQRSRFSHHEDEERPKPIMLLKNTERDNQGKKTPADSSSPQPLGRLKDGGGEDSKSDRGGGGGWEERRGSVDKWKRGDQGKDRRKEWDERPPKSGRDRERGGGGGGGREGGRGGEGRNRSDEWREKGGRWKEEGRAGGGRGGRGDYREEETYPPKRGDKRWEERGEGDRFGKERERDKEKEKEREKENEGERDRRGGSGSSYKERVREDQRRGGSGGGGRNKEKEEWRENIDGGKKLGGGGGGRNSRDGEIERRRQERERPGERRGAEVVKGKDSKDYGSVKPKADSSAPRDSELSSEKRPRELREAINVKEKKEDKKEDNRKDEGCKAREVGQPKSELSGGDDERSSSGKSQVKRSEQQSGHGGGGHGGEGGEEKSGDLSSSQSGDVRKKRKERPERQIYIPRRALEKQQRQNSPQSGEGDGGPVKGKEP